MGPITGSEFIPGLIWKKFHPFLSLVKGEVCLRQNSSSQKPIDNTFDHKFEL